MTAMPMTAPAEAPTPDSTRNATSVGRFGAIAHRALATT